MKASICSGDKRPIHLCIIFRVALVSCSRIEAAESSTGISSPSNSSSTDLDLAATPAIQVSKEESRELALQKSDRITIDTPRLRGSISLNGGRIDDLQLLDYNVRLNDESEKVTLLSPAGAPNAYFTMYGWAPAGSLSFEDVPGATTNWSVDGNNILTESTPVSLVWKVHLHSNSFLQLRHLFSGWESGLPNHVSAQMPQHLYPRNCHK